ncbi:MAG: PPC domain-containing protein [Gemmataceae bacterium]
MSRIAILLAVPFAFALSPSASSQDQACAREEGRAEGAVREEIAAAHRQTRREAEAHASGQEPRFREGSEGEQVGRRREGEVPLGEGGRANYPAERIGDSEVQLELDLPKDAKPGEVKLTAIGPGGDSNAYVLLIRDAVPVIAEKEPNDGFEQAQPLTLPCAVEATIKNERDVDVFKIEGKKGDKLRIEVQAARFGSPVDAMCVLYSVGREAVASADTANAPDPVIVVTLPKDGPYFLSIQDANDLGGGNFGYRLLVQPEK